MIFVYGRKNLFSKPDPNFVRKQWGIIQNTFREMANNADKLNKRLQKI